MNPTHRDALDEFKRGVKELGLRGFKLSPVYQKFEPMDPGACRIYSQAQEWGIPLMFHTATAQAPEVPLRYADPVAFDDVAYAFPRLKIVLAQKREQTLGDLKATVDWAKTRPGVRADRVGVTGWCWGGSTTIQAAASNPDMKAAVAWYGPPGRPYQGASGPVTGFDVAKDIKIPFLFLLGSTDTNPPVADGRKFAELVKQVSRNVEIVIYEGAGHGFHADYRPSYNPIAAADAWQRCLDWFNQYLKG